MNNLTVKARLLILSVIPLVLLSSITLVNIFIQVNKLSQEQLQISKEMFLESKKEELKQLVDMAWTSVREHYQSGGDREVAVELLSRMEFGEDGYIFGYDDKAVRVFSGSSSQGIGDSYYDFKDVNGVYLIRELIEAGRKNEFGSGDHFVSYHFPRLGQTQHSAKLSYSIYFPKWKLMVGTGIYIDRIEEQATLFEASLGDARDGLIWSVLTISAVLTAILAVLGMLIARSILKPLHSIGESVQSIASGNGDLTRRLPADSKTELGLVAGNVNQLLDSLHAMISEIKGIAGSVGTETETLNGGVEKLKQVSVQQHREIDQVATAMTEMSMTSRETAQNASSAASAAGVANTNSTQAAESVHETCAAMRILGQEIANASKVITEVGQDVENIGEVLQVIESIAEQTNLLALNAAIEAARAGEQGRGFAVVADEVRNLASKTQGSTEEIQTMIAKLQSGSRAAVEVMAESITRSDLAEASVSHMAKMLEEISDSIGVINDMNSQIATAAEEQSVVGTDISERVACISSQTNESSAIATDNEQSASRLRQKTQELQAIVEGFAL